MANIAYHLCLSSRNVRECVSVIGKLDDDLSRAFEQTFDIIKTLASLVTKHLDSLEHDLIYWKNLQDSSKLRITLTRWNDRAYRLIRRLISSFHPKYWNINRILLAQMIDQIKNGLFLKSTIDFNDEFDLDNRVSILVSMRRELACVLSILHTCSFRMHSIYREILNNELSYDSLMKIQNEKNKYKKSHFSGENPKTLEANNALFSSVNTILKVNLRSIIDILAKLNGIDTDDAKTCEVSYCNESTSALKNLFNHAKTMYSELLKTCAINPDYPLTMTDQSIRRPTAWQRHWVRYSYLCISGVFGARKLYLCIMDGTLYKAALFTVDSIRMFLTDHIVEPVTALAKELFESIQNREVIVSKHDLDQSREALHRMLQNFSQSNQGIRLFQNFQITLSNISERASNAVNGGSAALVVKSQPTRFSPDEAYEALMRSYEADLPNPVRGVLFGNLSTAILIQMQKLKVHTEGAMLKMDKVLASNQLTMAATAALPAFFLVGGFVYAMRPFFRKRKHSLTEENLRLRLALTDVERSLLEVYHKDDLDEQLPSHDVKKLQSRSFDYGEYGRQSTQSFESSKELEEVINLQRTTSITSIDRGLMSPKRRVSLLEPTIPEDNDRDVESLYNLGMLYYRLFRMRRELDDFFALPSSEPSSAEQITIPKAETICTDNDSEVRTLGQILYYPIELISAALDTWLWSREMSDPVVSEYHGILKDIRDLEASAEVVSGSRKIMTVMRMRNSYRCFIPKV